jgi:two-component system sensor histidine kinase DesK
MLLRGALAAAVAALPVLGTLAALVMADPVPFAGVGVAEKLAWGVFWLSAGFTVGVAATYGSVWLVRIIDELQATRTELAEVAIGRERLRVSRDLHDLLGQSLSAVSLKGDLALRLLSRDPDAARAQIENLTAVARDALAGMRAVTRDEHAVSLEEETRGVRALLSAAGIETRIDVAVLPGLAPAVQDVLAWSVREGVTNVLRHSDARVCSISVLRRGGTVRLEMVNDGAHAPKGEGSGLAGLAERARALSGAVSAEASRGGRFRLLVEIPEETI